MDKKRISFAIELEELEALDLFIEEGLTRALLLRVAVYNFIRTDQDTKTALINEYKMEYESE